MYKLYCDVCSRHIEPDSLTACIAIDESVYMGDKDFYKDSTHYSGSKILCSHCTNNLNQFLKIEVEHPFDI